MLENRGQVSRSLVRVTLPEGARAGQPLRHGEENVGELTSVAAGHGLAMVKRAHALAGTSLESGDGAAVVVGIVG